MSMIQPSTLGRSHTGRFDQDLLCGVAFYVVFFFAFFCAIGLVESLLVPKAIDTGNPLFRRARHSSSICW